MKTVLRMFTGLTVMLLVATATAGAVSATQSTKQTTTWTLTGETSPQPGNSYEYTVEGTGSSVSDARYYGFYTSTSERVEHVHTFSPQPSFCDGNFFQSVFWSFYFCANFTPDRDRGYNIFGDVASNYDAVVGYLRDGSLTKVTLHLSDSVPVGTVIYFGPLARFGMPLLDDKVEITVTEAPTSSPSVETTTPQPSGPTAQFSELPEAGHDGRDFNVELHFSEEMKLGYRDVRDRLLKVGEGQVTRVRRLTPGSNQQWEITVRPDSNASVSLELPVPPAGCPAAGAACSTDDQPLSASHAVVVPGTTQSSVPDPPTTEAPDPTPLTAQWSPPASHDGPSTFSFTLSFSEQVSLSYLDLRDHVLDADNGSVTYVRRLTKGSNQHWEVGVLPASNSDVTLQLAGGGECSERSTVCTPDGRSLSSGLSVTVSGSGS